MAIGHHSGGVEEHPGHHDGGVELGYTNVGHQGYDPEPPKDPGYMPSYRPVEEPGDSYPPEVFDNMKRDILLGNLSVKVYNKDLMTQPKWLAINRMANRILLLGENRLCDDPWEIASLKWIVK